MSGSALPTPQKHREGGRSGADPSSVQVIRRALTLLEVLSRASGPRSLSDISRRADLHKSTALRILRTLADSGYTVHERDSRRWRLGPGILRLQAGARQRNDLRSVALPVMRRLCEDIGETVQLANLVDDEICYLEKAEPPPQGVRILTEPGSRRPAYCTALGKVLLSSLSEDSLDELLGRLSFHRFTEQTITDPEKLRDQIRAVPAAGHAVDNREYNRACVCAAAPVRDDSGAMIAGLSVSTIGLEAESPAFLEIIAKLKATAEELSRELGWQEA